MIETRKWLPGILVDQADFDLLDKTVDDALSEITNAKGKGGSYEVIVRWYTENESRHGRDLVESADALAKATKQLQQNLDEHAHAGLNDLGRLRAALAAYEKVRWGETVS